MEEELREQNLAVCRTCARQVPVIEIEQLHQPTIGKL
jgi:hypothetical protein